MIPREGRPLKRKSHGKNRNYSPDPKFNVKHNVNKISGAPLPYGKHAPVAKRIFTKQYALREIIYYNNI